MLKLWKSRRITSTSLHHDGKDPFILEKTMLTLSLDNCLWTRVTLHCWLPLLQTNPHHPQRNYLLPAGAGLRPLALQTSQRNLQMLSQVNNSLCTSIDLFSVMTIIVRTKKVKLIPFLRLKAEKWHPIQGKNKIINIMKRKTLFLGNNGCIASSIKY